MKKEIDDFIQRQLETLDEDSLVIQRRLDVLIAEIGDVASWQKLAATDRRLFRTRLSSVLHQYKRLLNSVSGIEFHRPKNKLQNSLIWEIKTSKPTWSFGQIAREYTRRTGEPMTAKIAERTYARVKPDPQVVLKLTDPTLTRREKLLGLAKEALRLSRQKSRAT